jgi:hypothetical protein
MAMLNNQRVDRFVVSPNGWTVCRTCSQGVCISQRDDPKNVCGVAEGCCGRKFRNMVIEIVDIPIRNGDFP